VNAVVVLIPGWPRFNRSNLSPKICH